VAGCRDCPEGPAANCACPEACPTGFEPEEGRDGKEQADGTAADRCPPPPMNPALVALLAQQERLRLPCSLRGDACG